MTFSDFSAKKNADGYSLGAHVTLARGGRIEVVGSISDSLMVLIPEDKLECVFVEWVKDELPPKLADHSELPARVDLGSANRENVNMYYLPRCVLEE